MFFPIKTHEKKPLVSSHMIKGSNSRVKRIIFILLCLLSVLILSGCDNKEKTYRESRVVMYTGTTITVVSPSHARAKEAIDAGFTEIKRLEALLNYFSPDSEISAINRAAGRGPVTVSDDTIDIVKKAIAIAEDTGGAFNPTIGPIMKLWEFSKEAADHPLPSGEMISETLKLVDYRKVRVNEADSQVFLVNEGMEIDLGGIAKGYAADKAIEAIRAHGIRSALVAIAGDIRSSGVKGDHQPWKVGVQDPRSGDSESPDERYEIFTTINLSDKAVSTSGDYQRFFFKEGKRYHHIIDPTSGYPTESRLISVSVMADEGYITDGLSTGIFILGPEKGISLLESKGLEGILVDADKRVYLTKNLIGTIHLLKQEYRLAE